MKHLMRYGVRELNKQKLTSGLIIIAIILSTMMTTVIAQSFGIMHTLRLEQAINFNGNRHVTLHEISEGRAKQVASESQVAFAGNWIQLGVHKIEETGLSLVFREYQGNAISTYNSDYRIVEGHLPQKANEIAIPQNVMELIDKPVQIGDSVSFDLIRSMLDKEKEQLDFTGEFVVTGILESNHKGYLSGVIILVVGEGTAKQLLPNSHYLLSTDILMEDLSHFQNNLNQLAIKYEIDEGNIQYNNLLLDTLRIDYLGKMSSREYSGFSLITIMGILVGVLVLLAAGLVVYNIVKIYIIKKIKDYGTLRALGANKAHIYYLVLFEVILLCVIAIPIGMLVGFFLAEGILTRVVSFLNPEIFMASSAEELVRLIKANSNPVWISLLGSSMISGFFALLASVPSARYAANISPKLAMTQDEVHIKIKRKRKTTKNIPNFYRFYAKLNLMRNRVRTMITISSLVMSITVFVALQAFIGILDVSRAIESDFDYTLESELMGFSKAHLLKLEENKMIEDVLLKATLYYNDIIDRNSETAPPNVKDLKVLNVDLSLGRFDSIELIGINEAYLYEWIGDTIEQERLQRFIEGEACIIKNPIEFIEVGGERMEYTQVSPTRDLISIQGQVLEVLEVLESESYGGIEQTLNSTKIILSDTLFDKITGMNTYHYATVKRARGVNANESDFLIKSIVEDNPGSYFISFEETKAEMEESAQSIITLSWSLIFFIGLIGILNIINTVYTNIHTRIKEIGIGRAIGVDIAGLYKIFLWEGAYYGIYAAVIGNVLGYLFAVMIHLAITEKIDLFTVPVVQMVVVSSVSILVCLVSTYIPLRSIIKLNIVESIEVIE